VSTQLAYGFDGAISGLVRDQSGYLADLTVTGGTAAQGHGDSGLSGGMNCSSGGGVGQLPQYMFQNNTGFADRSGSFMMWAKATGSGSSEQVLFHVRSTAQGAFGNTDDVVLWASRGDSQMALQWQGTVAIPFNLFDGAWHFVSVQTGGDLSSGGLVVKVDDTVVYSDTKGANSGTITSGAFALGQATDGTRAFSGVIDDFRALNDPIDSAGLGTSNAEFMATPVRSLLEVEYGFDEGTGSVAHDTSGRGNDLLLTSQGWVTGKHGSALDISGEAANSPDGSVTISPPDSPRWTLMCWFRADTAAAPATGTVYSLAQVAGTDGSLRCELLLHAEDGYWGVYPRVYDSAGAQWYATSYHNSMPQDGAWHHLAVTVFPTGARTYVDGAPLDPDMNNAPQNAHDGWSVIGVGGLRFASPPSAQVDDLRLVSNYLYPDAISRQMAAESTAPPSSVNDTFKDGAQPSGFFLGSTPVSRLYLGGSLVFG